MIDIAKLFEIAKVRFDKQDYEKAENLFLQLHHIQPKNSLVSTYLGKIAFKLTQYERALDIFSAISETELNNIDVIIGLGRAYFYCEQQEKALICLERGLAVQPKSYELHILFAELFLSQSDLNNAMQSACQAVSIDSKKFEAHAMLGDILLAIGEFEKAINCYENALKIEPDNWKAVLNNGLARKRLGNLTGAKDMLTFANALQPLQADVLIPLTGILLDLFEFSDADMIINKLGAILPKSAIASFYKGVRYYRLGELKNAIHSLLHSLSIDDANIETCHYLATALTQEKMYDNAIKLYEQMIQNDRDQPFAYCRKAEAYLTLKDFPNAYESIRTLQEKIGDTKYLEPGFSFEGKSVHLYSQFGMTSFIVLIRFAYLLLNSKANIHIQTTEALYGIVKDMDKAFNVRAEFEQEEKFDLSIPLEALLLLFDLPNNKTVMTSNATCFNVNSELAFKWKTHFSGVEKLKVGIMWRKENHPYKDIYNSLSLQQFEPLFDLENIHWVTLQTSVGLEEFEDAPFKEKLEVVGLENSSLDERLACVSELDLLIAPDCYTALVAAGAGLPVWIISSKSPEWYLAHDDEPIWLSSVKTFLKQNVEDTDVYEEVKEQLKKLQG